MKNRILIVVVALIAIAGLLACSTGSLLSRTEPTATPTKTPKPTFTVTLTPTNTPIPTDTPLPTPTHTPTPDATNTPIVWTATPTDTPPPTDTPLPTVPPTNTPRPTARPTNRPPPTATPRPQPTNTPAPQFAWNGSVTFTAVNCGLTRLFGHTLLKAGGLAGDVWVHYWTEGWAGAWARSSHTEFGTETPWKGDEGNWDGLIDGHPVDGLWRICVVDQQNSTNCISNIVNAATAADCHSGSPQVIHITFRQN